MYSLFEPKAELVLEVGLALNDFMEIDTLTKEEWAALKAKKEAAVCAANAKKLATCEADLKAEKASCGAYKKSVGAGLTKLRAALAAKKI